jgi:ABC-type transporter MlaC component
MRSFVVVVAASVILGVILFAGRSEATPTDELRLQVTRIFEVLGDLAAVRQIVEQMYVSRFEMYRDDHINYLEESIVRDAATVRTMVVPKRGAEMPVDYRMHLQSRRWQVCL